MIPTMEQALKDTVRVYPKADENPLSIALNVVRDPVLPPWGTRQRERALRLWYRNSYGGFVQGVIMGIITKYLASPWEVTGPKSGVNYAPYFQDILREMPPGDGWDGEWSKTWLDYFRQDGGGYLEVIGPGKADSELSGRITGLANLDSLRCYPTADPDFPVIYWDRNGGRHKMHTSRILHFVDMPDGDDFNPGYGLCALSRAIAIVEQQYYMQRYARESLDELPTPGFLTVTGMTSTAFQKAMDDYLERKSRDLPAIYGNLVTLFGADAAIAPKLEFQGFSKPPENFNYAEWINLQINALALAFGIDKQEIWELSGRGIGSAGQSATLHAKSETKTIGHMRALAERRLNSTLPRSCEFAFKVKDGQQAQDDAANAQTWAATATSLVPLIGQQLAAKILANQVEAFADALLDSKGELVRLNDADVQDEEAQVSGGDAAPVNPNAPTPPAPPAVPAAAGAPGTPAVAAAKDFADTRAQFVANILDLFRAGNQDDLTRRRAGVVMRAQLNSGGKQARLDGLIEGGVTSGLSQDDLNAHTVWLAKQSQFVTDALDSLYKSGWTDAQVAQHAEMWANKSLQLAYLEGVQSADANGTYVFGGKDGNESCATCKSLKGTQMRMSEWTAKKLRPGVDTENFDCGGWQCLHTLSRVQSNG